MATIMVDVSDELMAVGKVRAARVSFNDLAQFVAQLIASEATGGPEGLTVGSDLDLKSILESRSGGPFVDFNSTDFENLRRKLRVKIDAEVRP